MLAASLVSADKYTAVCSSRKDEMRFSSSLSNAKSRYWRSARSTNRGSAAHFSRESAAQISTKPRLMTPSADSDSAFGSPEIVSMSC